MLEIVQQLSAKLVPVFVVLTMFNVGLTQTISQIFDYWRHWKFVISMLIANFILAPLLMLLMLHFTNLPVAYETGLLLLSVCAGAPFLIKLTQTSGHNLALGASVMLLLMLVTVGYAPMALPRLLEGVAVDALAVAKMLGLQMVLPILLGMISMRFLPGASSNAQPWVAKLGNWALYAVIATTLIGYIRSLPPIFSSGAIIPGVLFILGSLAIGYYAGRLASAGEDHLEDIGGLGTAQRNTAAGMIIATQNFTDPDIMVVLTIVNTLGLLLLLGAARLLSRDNQPPITKPPVSNR